MAFRINDFKKTVRGQGVARQIYPYQIRDERYTAALSFMISYFERMVGRRQAEFEADALLEFFGDPRLARGLVACMGRSYSWRSPSLSERLGEQPAAALAQAGVARPIDLRARLYALANERYGGFVSFAERPAALEALCGILDSGGSLAPTLLERGLTLDAEEERVLVKLGPTPTPDTISACYNFHALDTALVAAEEIQLRLSGDVWALIRSLHNLSRRYRLAYTISEAPRTLFDSQLGLTLSGGRDLLGEGRRAGRRLARALLRLLASHPGCVETAEARLSSGGKAATLRLDQRALKILGAAPELGSFVGEAWDDDPGVSFRQAWGRALLAGRTAGWRLRRDPEPLVGIDSLIVPDFAARRGPDSLAICLISGRAMAEGLASGLRRHSPRLPLLVILPEHLAPLLRSSPARLATYGSQPIEAIAQVVALLEERPALIKAAA